MNINLVNYANIYALSAAICTAFIGVAYIRNYIIGKIVPYLTLLNDNVREALNETEAAYNQFQKFNKISSRISITTKIELNKISKKLGAFMTWCSNHQSNLSIDKETEKIKLKLIALFSYVFFLHCYIMFMAGIEVDKLLSFNVTYFLVLFNLHFLVGLLVLHSLNLKSPHRAFYLSAIIFFFTASFLWLCITAIDHTILNQTIFIVSLVLSFLFIPLSILSVLIRILWWKKLSPKITLQKIKRNQKYITKGNKSIAADIVNLIPPVQE